MARIKGDARASSKHTGDEYGIGFQYRYPTNFVETSASWESVAFDGDRTDMAANIAAQLENGILINGAVHSLGKSITPVVTTVCRPMGAFNMILGTTEYLVHFLKVTATNVLDIVLTSILGTARTSTALGLGSSIAQVSAVPWGDNIYFGSAALTSGIYRFLGGSATLIASTPGAISWLGVLQNNLVAVYQTGGVWTVGWSVDSLPENFTGVGSGSTPIFGLGNFVGAAVMRNDDALLMFTSGAVIIRPTGTIPAFRIEGVNAIKGCPIDKCIVAAGDRVIYKGHDGTIKVFDGSSVVTLPILAAFGYIQNIYYSTKYSKVFVRSLKMLVLDPDSLKWIGSWSQNSSDYAADSPLDNGSFSVFYWDATDTTRYSISPLDSGTFLAPDLTVVMDLGENRFVDYIELQDTIAWTTEPTLVLTYYTDDTTSGTLTDTDPQDNGKVLRYAVNRFARVLIIRIHSGTVWSYTQFHTAINVIGHTENLSRG